MKIRILPLLVGGGGLVLNALAATPETSTRNLFPNDGMVTMSLTELRALWEKSKPEPKTPPPVVPPARHIVGELVLEVHLEPHQSRGTLSAQVQSLVAEWQRVPLLGGDVAVESVKGLPAVEVVDGRYGLLMQDASAVTLEMAVALPGIERWQSDSPVAIHFSPATCRKVLIHGVPKGFRVVAGDRRMDPSESGNVALSVAAADETIKLSLAKVETAKAPISSLQLAQAVVSQFACQQRVVMDGGLLSQVTLTVKHQADTKMSLSLPAGADLLQCVVGGSPALPTRTVAGIEIVLSTASQTDAGTKLELTYFTKLLPLNPAGASLNLELPHTDLFHEQLEWNITLPESLQATSLKSNATPTKPVQAAQAISLKREFWKSDPVTAEIFYEGSRK